MRNIEALHAKQYWQAFYKELGAPAGFHRRDSNPYSQALDANSKFVSSIILRWISYHHMSPYHGFLHEPSDYPALMYDLFEPYRSLFDQHFLRAWKLGGMRTDPKTLTPATIAISKEVLNNKVYVPLTRQIVTYQELLHGVVISLKYYLNDNEKRFLIPLPGKPNGGRPSKVKFYYTADMQDGRTSGMKRYA
ncbi:MAG: CRISPR-associated endonuclease Cas1 [Candidatus Saccharimonadales bacterium]